MHNALPASAGLTLIHRLLRWPNIKSALTGVISSFYVTLSGLQFEGTLFYICPSEDQGWEGTFTNKVTLSDWLRMYIYILSNNVIFTNVFIIYYYIFLHHRHNIYEKIHHDSLYLVDKIKSHLPCLLYCAIICIN